MSDYETVKDELAAKADWVSPLGTFPPGEPTNGTNALAALDRMRGERDEAEFRLAAAQARLTTAEEVVAVAKAYITKLLETNLSACMDARVLDLYHEWVRACANALSHYEEREANYETAEEG